MQLKEAYLDQVVGEVEDLSARVALLKGRFAQQKVSVDSSTTGNSNTCAPALRNLSVASRTWNTPTMRNSIGFKRPWKWPGRI